MISRIFIRNYALIRELEISFYDELSILSGETGAGKSIILNSLNLAFGENLDTAFINDRENNVVVEVQMKTENADLLASLEENGLDTAGGELLLRRVYNPKTGKNGYFINDTPVGKNLLTTVYEATTELVGQHENQKLLNVSSHIDYLDSFAHITNEVAAFRTLYESLGKATAELEALTGKKGEQERRKGYIEFAIEEIEKINPKPADLELYEERQLLQHRERIADTLEGLQNYLKGDMTGEKPVYKFIREVEGIARFDSKLAGIGNTLEEIEIRMQDLSLFVSEYLSSLDFSEDYVRKLDSRIDELESLKRKYGPTLERVMEEKDRMKEELELFEGLDEKIAGCEHRIKTLKDEVSTAAKTISEKRRIWAKNLEHLVEENLRNIGMENVRFVVYITYQEDVSSFCRIEGIGYKLNPRGMDYVEFAISTNPGQPVKSLRKIASGGEISRIMLALKKSLALYEPVETFIFDEIDAGIGGKTADLVGAEIRNLAKNKQIICITHLPQIAVYGNRHFSVSKSVNEGTTEIRVSELVFEERVNEIARMLSGDIDSQKARDHARELLEGKGA